MTTITKLLDLAFDDVKGVVWPSPECQMLEGAVSDACVSRLLNRASEGVSVSLRVGAPSHASAITFAHAHGIHFALA